MNCPQCGSSELKTLSTHYDVEVRRVGVEPAILATFAPPTRRASIHGFVLAVLVWISFLAPFFVAPERILRTVLMTLIPTLLWILIYRRARQYDQEQLGIYRSQWFCLACGWRGDLTDAAGISS